jgi:hypothetical protein
MSKFSLKRALFEMPHVDVENANIRLHAKKHVILIDFRIEHLPISSDEKRDLLRAFKTTGFIARINEVPFVFVDDDPSVRRPTSKELERLPCLPNAWIGNAEFVEE